LVLVHLRQFLTHFIRTNYERVLSHIAIREDSAPVDYNDPNDATTVEINLTDSDKEADLLAHNDKPVAVTGCQCGQYLFCNECLPEHLLIKGCWYEERTLEEQQHEIAHELERRRQQGAEGLEASPYHPIVRIRRSPDGKKLVFRTKSMYFSLLARLLTQHFMTVTPPR
jgi:hypothetical protein